MIMIGEAVSGVVSPSTQKSLEMLFDYTKFHIGLYLTLTASYIAVASLKINDKPVFQTRPNVVRGAVVFFMIAGLAGGVIASSITQTCALSSREFLELPIGPWNWAPFRGLVWTWIEHTSFWIGLLLAFFSIQITQKHVSSARFIRHKH